MSNPLFFIPIHINALYLKEGRTVVEPMANFSRLPYFDGTRDVNRNFGNISELLIPVPFQNQNLYLPAGMHLHWDLPTTLSKGISQDNSSLKFPAVPNRWLVIRKRKQNNNIWNTENIWIVESDYLWGIGETAKSVTIPLSSSAKDNKKYQPYRYLGRQFSLADWLNHSNGEYWGNSLTAIGYGETTFAAFYPNCYSVFGCYDSEIQDVNNTLSYDILGWYSNKSHDLINNYLNQVKKQVTPFNLEEAIANFADNLQWKITEKDLAQIYNPTENKSAEVQIICYGRLQFEPKPPETNSKTNLDSTKVVLANSGTEALSSYLAAEVEREITSTKIEKRTLENLLEALQLATSLEDKQTDLESKLQDARHEKAFTATKADSVWIIEQVKENKPNNEQKQENNYQISLPEEMAGLLLEINQLQKQYNRGKDEIESRREQLFADWYKYILCAYPPIGRITEYPDPNLVRIFIQTQGVIPLQEQLIKIENLLDNNNLENFLKYQEEKNKNNFIAGKMKELQDQLKTNNRNSIASKLQEKLKTLNLKIQEFNNLEKVKQARVSYQLKAIPSPRYWEPNEPVVMIVGDITQSNYKQQDNSTLLDCCVWEKPQDQVFSLLNKGKEIATIKDGIQFLINKLDELITHTQNQENKAGLTIWQEEPWQPFILEWEVNINTEQNGNRYYANNLILSNYNFQALGDSLVDLKRQSVTSSNNSEERKRFESNNFTDLYYGHNILTDYAALKQAEKLQEYFQKQPIFDEYRKHKNIDNLTWDFLNTEDLSQWLENLQNIPKKNIYIALVKVYQKLQTTKCLSQCLGGLNQALLGRKQTLQLNIGDPIGFSDYEPFIDSVAIAIEQSLASAPQPLNFFNPIRLGDLKIQRLRLIDTFGTSRDVPLTVNIITPEYLKLGNTRQDAIALPPRLVQPARIDFRWLCGNNKYQGESASHPSLSPICGWILSDRIDKTIEVYNAEGRSLGELEIKKIGDQRWRPAPGSSQAIRNIADIPNPYLRKVVEYLDQKTDQFLEQFILALSKAWENIEPNNFDSNPSIALLMGQPMAIVRASINLELQGLPAVNQDWDVFRQDLRRSTRETNGFPTVYFPLRLGDYRRKSDGLIGYWLENQAGNLSDSIYIAQAKLTEENSNKKTTFTEPLIVTKPGLINQSIQDPPQIVTMLIDPRTSINLVSGILPPKNINIYAEHYVDALNAIETTFLTAPILTPRGKIYLPLVEEQNYSWSWLEKESSKESSKENSNVETWSEISSIGKIQKSKFLEAIRQQMPDLGAEELWNYLLDQKISWLKDSEDNPTNAEIKLVVPFDKRTNKELTKYKNQQKQIDFILDLCTVKISQSSIEAIFYPQEIREGWLKLKKVHS